MNRRKKPCDILLAKNDFQLSLLFWGHLFSSLQEMAKYDLRIAGKITRREGQGQKINILLIALFDNFSKK